MKKIDRRQWLRGASLASMATLVGGLAPVGAKNLVSPSFPARPFPVDGPIRLSSNENPFGPSPKVRQAIQDAFHIACRYPSASRDGLLAKIAAKEGVSPEHIVITSGSTEGLKVTGLTYGVDSGEIIAADPTFKALTSYAEQFGAHIHRVPVDKNLQHDLDAMEQRISNRTTLLFMCNPNNPTGALLPANDYMSFCKRVSKRTLVFSDEAYCDFITEPDYPSMTTLVKQGYNVIVSKTFSKVYGLAGLRIGYLVARPDIAARLIQNRIAFTNVLALAAATTAIEEKEFYDFSLKKTMEAKATIYTTLDEIGLEYIPSHGNFVFFKTGQDIQKVNAGMKKRGVLVGRPFPPLNDWCRISTGTLEETQRFNEALKDYFS